MAQQMVNGSYYHGDITVTNRMTDRYAVVNPPEMGKHRSFKRHRKNIYSIKDGVLVKKKEG